MASVIQVLREMQFRSEAAQKVGQVLRGDLRFSEQGYTRRAQVGCAFGGDVRQ